jgi:TRAP-type transport system periplasmic protein
MEEEGNHEDLWKKEDVMSDLSRMLHGCSPSGTGVLLGAVAAAIIGVGISAGTTSAQELPATHVINVGSGSAVRHTWDPEERFWEGYVPERSNGKITVDRRSYVTLGLAPDQMLRLVMSGVVDFVWSDISQVAGDDPLFEGCDLAGLALDIETARAACEAWKPAIARTMADKFNVKLLAMGTNPPQVFWCRDPIESLDDLRGRKVRVFNKTMTDFIAAVGGAAVTVPFPEVIPALQQGVVDCAVTGTGSGNTAGWPEVTDDIYPLYLGWVINFQAVNRNSWQRSARRCRRSSKRASRSWRTTCGRPPRSRPTRRTTATPAATPARSASRST